MVLMLIQAHLLSSSLATVTVIRSGGRATPVKFIWTRSRYVSGFNWPSKVVWRSLAWPGRTSVSTTPLMALSTFRSSVSAINRFLWRPLIALAVYIRGMLPVVCTGAARQQHATIARMHWIREKSLLLTVEAASTESLAHIQQTRLPFSSSRYSHEVREASGPVAPGCIMRR
ncbi:hypothetical protein P280DRAFT_967 [Massarina eburnea CBS 473.64]|uniref:Secreted protein n=1 Tax=Massarina eburnea CBS 473.64 TaxID=1395130 RepID=A0A6A6SIL0_9PLEO|nr:hypothetical protein P280DRAFT_967 [Massarina eburnea CBS 473.64]